MKIKIFIVYFIALYFLASGSYAADLQTTLIGKTNSFLDNVSTDLSERLLNNDTVKQLIS